MVLGGGELGEGGGSYELPLYLQCVAVELVEALAGAVGGSLLYLPPLACSHRSESLFS